MAVYILEAHGKEKLSLLLKEYDLGKDHDEAFMSAFHRSLDEFEADWETWIRSKFEIVVPATLTPAPQALQGQGTPSPFPGRRALGIIVLLCCLSSLGATGLGLVVFLLQSRAKKTTETNS